MKKLITVVLILALALPAAALAETPPLTSYSIEELESMLGAIRTEILSRSEWDEVTVPPGHYVIGEDIPAGHWTIKYAPENICIISYFQNANTTGIEPADRVYDYNSWRLGDPNHEMAEFVKNEEIDLQLTEGYHLNVESGSVIFTPFAGRQSPFFK